MTGSQHMRALAKANGVRLDRAAVKRALFDRRITLAEALGDPSLQSMPVGDLLAAQWRWGATRTSQLLSRLTGPSWNVWVSWSRPVGQLTERERVAIIQACGRGPK